MYPIDARQLVCRATLGSNALDPTVPARPSRRLRAKKALGAVLRETSNDRAPAVSTHEAVTARSS
jgi:hypothetical protein